MREPQDVDQVALGNTEKMIDILRVANVQWTDVHFPLVRVKIAGSIAVGLVKLEEASTQGAPLAPNDLFIFRRTSDEWKIGLYVEGDWKSSLFSSSIPSFDSDQRIAESPFVVALPRHSYGLVATRKMDGAFSIDTVAGRPAWCAQSFQNGGHAKYLYFDVDSAFLHDGDEQLEIHVGYFSGNHAGFCLEYDSCDPDLDGVEQQFCRSDSETVWHTDEWSVATFRLDHARFANRANGTDFRLRCDQGRLRIGYVEVRRRAAQGPSADKVTTSSSNVAGTTGSKAPSGNRPVLAVAPFDAAQAKKHQQAWADFLGLPVEVTNSIGMQLVLIPPGEFRMGIPLSEIDVLVQQAIATGRPQWYIDRLPGEGPLHRVRITQPMRMGKYEVTRAQYAAVMATDPSQHISGSGDHPVESITWYDARDFCKKLSGRPAESAANREYRLPTEAEWEYACRAGTTTRYFFGDNASLLDNYAVWKFESFRDARPGPHPVGQKKPNAWGLFDILGNVDEWCSDWRTIGYYSNSPTDDPQGPNINGGDKIQRGGSWCVNDNSQMRCAHRGANRPGDPGGDSGGFRIVVPLQVENDR